MGVLIELGVPDPVPARQATAVPHQGFSGGVQVRASPPAYLAAGQRAGGTRSSVPGTRIWLPGCSPPTSSQTTAPSVSSGAATSMP